MSRTRRIASFLSVLALFGFAASIVYGDASDPGAQSSVLPSPTESGMPEKIARKEVRRIRREFTDLLDQERDHLRAELAKEKKANDAERKARRKDWDARERDARRKFFEEHPHGPDRRQYVKEFNDRRKTFYAQLKDEEKQDRAEQDAKWKALKDSQRSRLNSVEAYLRRSERPVSSLLQPVD